MSIRRNSAPSEQYAQSHPAASDAKFLLAENYLTCGYTDAAAVQLKEVVQVDPKDQLSAQLLKSISASSTVQPAVSSQPAALAAAAHVTSLVGNWTATRRISATIKLALAADGEKYLGAGPEWQAAAAQPARIPLPTISWFSSRATMPCSWARSAALANNRFNFKLTGDNPSDPGLTFVR